METAEQKHERDAPVIDGYAEHVKSILEARYLLPGEKTWEDLAKRVATALATRDSSIVSSEEFEEFYDAIANFKVIPNSPCLMNAGTPNGQLAACFGLPVGDSITGIFDAVKHAALIHKSGGGTGFNFSDIRPAGASVGSTGGVASGPVSFMEVFNAATETIKQGSKRRGANMGSLDVSHPDILKFIDAKMVEGKLSNFNISVDISDEFMKRVSNKEFDYAWSHDVNGNIITVGDIWQRIVDGMWRNGEPGILWSDAAERDNKTPHLGKQNIRNPCSEVILHPYECCILASVNLMKCINGGGRFDVDELKRLVKLGVRMLNRMIDVNVYPLDEVRDATLKTRKIGLGVMGFADLLIRNGIPYDGPRAVVAANNISRLMRSYSIEESAALANDDGVYPESRGDPKRNAALLSIAPTGTISQFAHVSSGIEPNMGWVYRRSTWVSGNEVQRIIISPALYMLKNQKLVGDATFDDVVAYAEKYGSLTNCPHLDCDQRSVFKICTDVNPLSHIKIQAAFQENVDQAISKTINCPNETTRDDISAMLIRAWELGCKGLTIYREGSRNVVVIKNTALGADGAKTDVHQIPPNSMLHRPDVLPGLTFKVRSGCGTLYVTVNENNGNPVEIFATTNNGGCSGLIEGNTRMATLAMSRGVPLGDVAYQLCKVKCSRAISNKRCSHKSCSDILGWCISEYMHIRDKFIELPLGRDKPECEHGAEMEYSGMKCPNPNCGAIMRRHDGCWTCPKCGESRCN